ncbi:MAG: sigma factor [Phycisphaerae bacterium]
MTVSQSPPRDDAARPAAVSQAARPRRAAAPDAAQLAALAQRVAAGDDDAFEQIHARLRAGMLRYFGGRIGAAPELAEELAQQAFVLTWQALRAGRYDPARAAVSTFVYAVAVKVWLRWRRDPRNDARATVARVARERPETSDVAEPLAAAELLDALRAALAARDGPDALADDEREVLLALVGGESERSLAARDGVAPSTIHTRKTAAIAKLRRRLVERGFSAADVERIAEWGE